jgi:hypothetical protein
MAPVYSAPSSAPFSPKKKNGKKIAAAIVLPLLLVGGSVALFWEHLTGFALRQFADPVDYYAYVEAKALEEGTDSFAEFYGEFLDQMEPDDRGMTTSVGIDVNQKKLEELLGSAMTKEEAGKLIAALNGLELTLDSDARENSQVNQNRFTLGTGKGTLFVLKMISDGDHLYLSLPELSPSVLKTPIANGEESFNLREEHLPDEETVKQILLRYG